MLPGAVAENEEGRITEGDLAPETFGAEGLEVSLDTDSPETEDLSDVGVEGAATEFAAAGCNNSAMFFPAILWESKIFHNAGPHVSCAEDDAILDSLDSLRNLTKNPELVPRKAVLRTLNIMLEAEFLHQVPGFDQSAL